MHQTYTQKKCNQVLEYKKTFNEPHNQLSQIHNDIEQIVQRDNDVKSSIQNLKRKLNISPTFDDMNFQQSSISIIEACGNCNTMRKKLEMLKTNFFPLKEQLKIMILQNTKLSKQNKNLESKILDLQEQVERKNRQTQIEIDKQKKLLVDFKIKDMQCNALLKQNNSLTTSIDKLRNEFNELKRQLETNDIMREEFQNKQNIQLANTVNMYISMLRARQQQLLEHKQKSQNEILNKQTQFKQIMQAHQELEKRLRKQIEQKQNVIQLITKSLPGISPSYIRSPNKYGHRSTSVSPTKNNYQSSLTYYTAANNLGTSTQLSFLQQQLKYKNQQVQNLNRRIIELQNGNIYYKQLISNYEVQHRHQAQKIQAYEQKISNSVIKDKNELMRQFQKIKKEVDESTQNQQNLIKNLQEMQLKYNRQFSLNQGLSTRLQQIQNTNKNLVSQNQQLKQNIYQLENKVKNNQYVHLNHQKQIQKQSLIIKELNQQIKMVTTQIEEKSRKLDLNQKNFSILEKQYCKQIKELEMNLKLKNKQIQQNDKVFEIKKIQYQNQLSKLIHQLNFMKQQLQYEHHRQATQTGLRNNLNHQNNIVRQALNKATISLKQTQKKWQQLNKKHMKLQKSNKQVILQLQQTKSENNKVSSQIQKLSFQNHKLSTKIQILQHQNKVLSNQLSQRQQTIQTLKIKNQNQYVHRLESLNNKLIQRKTLNIKLQAQNNHLVQQLKSSNNTINQLNLKINQLNLKIQQQTIQQQQLILKINHLQQLIEEDHENSNNQKQHALNMQSTLNQKLTLLQCQMSKQNELNSQMINNLHQMEHQYNMLEQGNNLVIEKFKKEIQQLKFNHKQTSFIMKQKQEYQLIQTEKQIFQYQQKFTSYQQQLTQYTQQISTLKLKMLTLQKQILQSNNLMNLTTNQLLLLKQSYDQKQIQFNELMQKNLNIQRKLQIHSNQHLKTQQQNNKILSQKESLFSKLQQVQLFSKLQQVQLLSRIQQIQQKSKYQLQIKEKQLREEHNLSIQKLNKQLQNLNLYKSENEQNKTKTKQQYEKQLQIKIQKITFLEQQNNNLVNQVNNLNINHKKLQQTSMEYLREVDKLNEEIKIITQQKVSLQQELVLLKQRISSILSQSQDKHKRYQQQIVSLTIKIQELQRQKHQVSDYLSKNQKYNLQNINSLQNNQQQMFQQYQLQENQRKKQKQQYFLVEIQKLQKLQVEEKISAQFSHIKSILQQLQTKSKIIQKLKQKKKKQTQRQNQKQVQRNEWLKKQQEPSSKQSNLTAHDQNIFQALQNKIINFLHTTKQLRANKINNMNQQQDFLLHKQEYQNRAQFKKNKNYSSPNIKIKHSYSDFNLNAKVGQKIKNLEQQIKKSVNFDNINENSSDQERSYNLSKRKQQGSIMLIENIGQAISMDDDEYNKKQFQKLSQFSLTEQTFVTPEKYNQGRDYHSEAPGFMTSQHSAISRQQMEDRYKNSIKNAKLSKKLKNKKKR